MKSWKRDVYRLTKKIADRLTPVLSVAWKHFSEFPVVKQLIEIIVTAFQMLKDVGESWRKSPLNLIIQWVNLFLSFIVFLVYFPEIISAHFEAFAQLDPLHQKIGAAFLGCIVDKICPSTIQGVFKTSMRQSVLLLAIYLGITAFVFKTLIVELLTRSYTSVCHFVRRQASKLMQTVVRFLFSLTSPA